MLKFRLQRSYGDVKNWLLTVLAPNSHKAMPLARTKYPYMAGWATVTAVHEDLPEESKEERRTKDLRIDGEAER